MTDKRNFHLETKAGVLAAAMKTVDLVRPRTARIPILTSVLLEDRRLVVTDLDQELSVPFAAAKMAGRLVLDGRALGVLRLLDAETDITIHATSSGALLSFPGGSYDLMSFAADDFPLLTGLGEDTEQLTGNAATGLPKALAGVRYAISTEETRYYLNGVAFGAINGESCVVATDGHRLAWQAAHVPFPDTWHRVIVPTDAVSVITKLGVCDAITVGFGEQEINVKINALGVPQSGQMVRYPRWLRVEAAGVKLTTKLIDGTYPDWHRVVPDCFQTDTPETAQPAHKMVLPVAATRRALRRLRMAQSGLFRITHATLTPQADGRIALSSRMEGELAVEVLPVAESAGQLSAEARLASSVSVNTTYLLNLLANADGEDVEISTCDPVNEARAEVGAPFGFTNDRGGHIMMPTRSSLNGDKNATARMQSLLTQDDVAGRAA